MSRDWEGEGPGEKGLGGVGRDSGYVDMQGVTGRLGGPRGYGYIWGRSKGPRGGESSPVSLLLDSYTNVLKRILPSSSSVIGSIISNHPKTSRTVSLFGPFDRVTGSYP